MGWYSIDSEGCIEMHETEDEARRAAEAALEEARDVAPDGWPEFTEAIQWGRLQPRQRVAKTTEPAPEGSEFDELWDFELRDEGVW
jgi:hypothetical protein